MTDDADARGAAAGAAPALAIDARGQRCPLPVIALARRIEEVEVDEVVAVLADDPAARVDVPAWCRMRGQDYLGELPDTDPGAPEGAPAGEAHAYLIRRRT